MSKEAVLKYGPDYYREYKPPVISRDIFPPKGKQNPKGIHAERPYYEVISLYDKTEEQLEWNYASMVRIWADTGKLHLVIFGNGIGPNFPEDGLQSDRELEPIRYQDATRPVYEPNNPEPVNKERLLRKGWVKNSDGQWEKTRPDVIPAKAQRVIERAKEDMRRREMNNR